MTRKEDILARNPRKIFWARKSNSYLLEWLNSKNGLPNSHFNSIFQISNKVSLTVSYAQISAGFRTITVSIGASSSSCSDATGDWLVYLQGGISLHKNSHTLTTPIHCNTSEPSWYILLVHAYIL